MQSEIDFSESRGQLKSIATQVKTTYDATLDLKAALVCIKANSEIRKTYEAQIRIKAATGKPNEL
jgi:hypothetical protein